MRKFALLTITMVLMAGLMALGCGGGGSPENVTYEGSTMPAVIDTTGSVDLAKAASLAGKDAEDTLPMSVEGAVSERIPGDPAGIVAYAKDVLAGTGAGGDVEPLAAVESLAYMCSDETYGDGFGGTITEEFCYDPVREKIRMTLTADGYDDGLEAIDGVLIIEGTEYSASVIFRDYFFADLFDEDEDFYADGIVTVKESGSTTTITYNLSMYDYLTDEGFWINNYKVVATDTAGGENVTITGRFYDFYGGYVDISTVTTLFIETEADYPSSGELQMTGAEGYWIKIRFDLDEGDVPWFQVDVNIDEDPEYDWQSNWIYWEPPPG